MAVNNIEKLITYISCVSKESILVNDKEYTRPINSIVLSPTFFHKDGCNSCGNCCTLVEHNVYTQHEYDYICNIHEPEFYQKYSNLDYASIVKLRHNIIPDIVNINGHKVALYVFKHLTNIQFLKNKTIRPERDVCSWLQDYDGKYYCNIHPVRSITCKMPHMRFFYNKTTYRTSIGVSQFGRNWALGCKILFQEPVDEFQFKEIKESRIEKLQHLQRCAKDLKIETHIPRIINYIQNIPFDNYNMYLEKDILHQHKSMFKL